MIVFHVAETERVGGYIWSILNSNFSAALFGALFGALSAHYIAQRSERRKSLAEGIAGCSTALAFANNVANHFVGIKRQHTKEMMRAYREAFEEYASVLRMPPHLRPVFNLRTDFRTMPLPRVGADELRKVVVDKLPAAASVINIVAVIQNVADTLMESMMQREQMFPYLRQLPPPIRADTYFGLRISEEMIDERYSDLMTAISNGVDDGIYFSLLSIDLLKVHGKKLQEQYGSKAPEVAKIIYAPFEEGILPDNSDYPDWERAYRKLSEAPTAGRWGRVINWFLVRFMRDRRSARSSLS